MLIIDKNMLANEDIYFLFGFGFSTKICKNRILVKDNVF